MHINDLIKITEGYFTNLPRINKSIKNFKTDSREVNKGDVFICINSGDKYIDDAIKNGCVCIISEKIIHTKTRVGIIKVESIKSTLLKLGEYIRNLYNNIPIIAITGSVGKTSTKELISSILETKYKVLKNEGNKNNYIGVTETLFKLNNNYDIVVMELGMNHFNEISEMSCMLKPDIAVITNIGTSHIGNLGSKKNIFKAKMEIIDGLRDGYIIVPPNDSYLSKLKLQNVLKCYDIDISHIKLSNYLKFKLTYQNKEYNIHFNIPNKTYINNILISFKTCSLFDININDIINKINEYKPLKKRMDIIDKDDYIIINDCYNSSYESLKGSLDYIKRQNKNKLIILGDILELGKFSKKIHKQINKDLKKINDKEVLLVGNETKYIEGTHFKNNQDIINYLKERDLKGYVILIKGSRLMHLEDIVDELIKTN